MFSMKGVVIIILIFISGSLFSQIDSINAVYKNTKSDTTKARILVYFSDYYSKINIDTLKYFTKKAIQICDKNIPTAKPLERENFKLIKGSAINNLAFYYSQKGMFDSSIYFYNASISIFKEVDNQNRYARSLTDLGYVYSCKGDNIKALEYYYKSLKIQDHINDVDGVTLTRNNIAVINFGLGEYDKALNEFLKCVSLQEKTNNLGNTALYLSNIGYVYSVKSDSVNALKYYRKSLAIRKEINDKSGIYILYNNIGILYNTYKNYNEALKYAFLSLQTANELGATEDIALLKNNIGNYYKKLNNFAKAYDYIKQGYEHAIQVKKAKNIYVCLTNMVEISERTGKYKEALEYSKLASALKDSLNNESIKKESYKKELDFDYSKKKAIDSLQIVANEKITDAKFKQEKTQRYALYGGVLMLVCLAFFIFNRLQVTKRQNLIIENQKLQVELKNEEITHQKELVDEKQKEIIDSINYAKRIQQAVLTGEDVWNKISKEHFILFKPKDIVSGDFYWAYNTPNNRSVFALADCTGHGVPGGFMSMLGNSFLNEIVVENKIFKSDQILNKLRAKIIQALEQKGGAQQKDGMDMSLCVWNKIDNTLEFSGANNPLWLLRTVVDANGLENKQLQEFKADKMPIGLYLDEEKPFTSVTIQLQKGDIIYLCTDGYADQFGGPKGKKLKYKPLMDLLITNSTQDMNAQKLSLEAVFNDWKVAHDQVDDVSLIGVKVV
ncbi:MAG: tetratricopeptide repeat protein [Bacteroidota bacterium]